MDTRTSETKKPPELTPYMVSTQAERDWVLTTALGYVWKLELERRPSERLTPTATGKNDSMLLRPFINYAAKKMTWRCVPHLSKSEDGAIHVPTAKSAGFRSEGELLWLAVEQHAYSVKMVAHRLARQGGSTDSLWQLYEDFMYFCHSEAYVLHAFYEERNRRVRIDRNVERRPDESYAEWRNRASPAIVELHPESLQFIRSEASPVVWREDRSEFHRRWVDEQIAMAWKGGYKPLRS